MKINLNLRKYSYTKNLFKIFLFLMIILNSCSDNTTIPGKRIIPCQKYDTSFNWFIQERYMTWNGTDSFKTYWQYQNFNISQPFSVEYVNFTLDTSEDAIPYHIYFAQNDTDISKILMDSLRASYKTCTDCGFAIGIDSIISPVQLDAWGWGGGTVWNGAALIESGSIIRYYRSIFGNNEYWKATILVTLAHELGHHTGMQEHGEHWGNHSECCIMNSPFNFCSVIDTNFWFCDRHACLIWQCIYNPSQNENIKSLYLNNNISLEFTLTTDKNEYYEGEPIWLNVKVKNIGNQSEKVEFWEDVIDRNLIVENPGGIITNNKYGLFIERLHPYQNIKSDSVITLDIEIINHFGDGSNNFGNRYFNIGEHIIKFTENSEYYAEPIKFYILKPSDVEKKNLDELYTIGSRYKNESSENMFNDYYYFAINHKNSIYFELAMNSLIINSSSYKMNKEQYNLLLWYINNYYNSGYMKNAINLALRISYNLNGGSQGALNFLNDIIKEYPNTKASKYAIEDLNNSTIKELYLK